jgi:hypothetical protein
MIKIKVFHITIHYQEKFETGSLKCRYYIKDIDYKKSMVYGNPELIINESIEDYFTRIINKFIEDNNITTIYNIQNSETIHKDKYAAFEAISFKDIYFTIIYK